MTDLLITHIDLDGVGVLVLNEIMNETKGKVFNEVWTRDYGFEYNEDDLKAMMSFERIFIVDLSIGEDIYNQLIDAGIIVNILDHHDSALWLNDKKVDSDKVTNICTLMCGTKLFYNYLLMIGAIGEYPSLNYFVELVNTYDMWDRTSSVWDEAVGLNSLLFDKAYYNWDADTDLEAKSLFINHMVDLLRDKDEFILPHYDKLLIERIKIATENEIRLGYARLQCRYDTKGRKFGITYVGKKISLVAADILDHTDYDYLIVFLYWKEFTGKLSIRSNKDDMDLTTLCASDGHFSATGGMLPPEICERFVNEGGSLKYKDDSTVDENDVNTYIKWID